MRTWRVHCLIGDSRRESSRSQSPTASLLASRRPESLQVGPARPVWCMRSRTCARAGSSEANPQRDKSGPNAQAMLCSLQMQAFSGWWSRPPRLFCRHLQRRAKRPRQIPADISSYRLGSQVERTSRPVSACACAVSLYQPGLAIVGGC